jgi:ribosomal protein S18 acetylase RimI-like enzyme
MQQFEVRQATPGDRDTLYRIHREAMRPYVEQVWGWDEEYQERRFRESYDHSETQVVLVDGIAVGLLRVSESESAVFIDQVEIVPDYQDRGIGTALINDLLARGRPVELRVMKVNADARRLYERLGFRVIDDNEKHYHVRAEPSHSY